MSTKRLVVGIVAGAVVAITVSGGCGPRMNPRETDDAGYTPSESTSTGDIGQTATTSVESSGNETPISCPEGEVACGDECADLRWSNEHCGSCGHSCMHDGVGECWEGECPPTKYCSMVDEGHVTCDGVCASHGQACVDADPQVPSACGGERYTLYYGLSSDFDCDVGFFASSLVMGACDEPIRWDLEGGPNGGSPPGAVSCCCTQP